MNAKNPGRRKAALITAAAAALLLLLMIFVPKLVAQGSPSGDPVPPAAPTIPAEECAVNVHYFTDDAPKSSAWSFGPDRYAQAVAATGTEDPVAILKWALQDLYNSRCVDPALTAAHATEWDWQIAAYNAANPDDQQPLILLPGETADAATQRFLADRDAWRAVVARLVQLQSESQMSIEGMDQYISQMYMIPGGQGNGVPSIVARNTGNLGGHAMVFSHPKFGKVAYRFECGWQPITDRPEGFGPVAPVVVCPPGTERAGQAPPGEDMGWCNPPKPKPTPTPTTPGENPKCPPGTHGTPPSCKDDPARDPSRNGNAPIGGGQNNDPGPGEENDDPSGTVPDAPYTPPAQSTPAPTERTVPQRPAEPGVNPDPGTGTPGGDNSGNNDDEITQPDW